jgi:hypothetical protein
MNSVADIANGSTATTTSTVSSSTSSKLASLFQPGDIISSSSSESAAASGASSSSSSSSGYRLEALAHSGPRSDVWKATRLADGSVVALKVRRNHMPCSAILMETAAAAAAAICSDVWQCRGCQGEQYGLTRQLCTQQQQLQLVIQCMCWDNSRLQGSLYGERQTHGFCGLNLTAAAAGAAAAAAAASAVWHLRVTLSPSKQPCT